MFKVMCVYETEKNGLQQRQQGQFISLPGCQLCAQEDGIEHVTLVSSFLVPVSRLPLLSICLPPRDHRYSF